MTLHKQKVGLASCCELGGFGILRDGQGRVARFRLACGSLALVSALVQGCRSAVAVVALSPLAPAPAELQHDGCRAPCPPRHQPARAPGEDVGWWWQFLPAGLRSPPPVPPHAMALRALASQSLRTLGWWRIQRLWDRCHQSQEPGETSAPQSCVMGHLGHYSAHRRGILVPRAPAATQAGVVGRLEGDGRWGRLDVELRGAPD